MDTTIEVSISGDGPFATAARGAERWCFVVCRDAKGHVWSLSLCLYSDGTATWDGMASQNQPRVRCDRPKATPREIAIAVFDVVGWPVSPAVQVTDHVPTSDVS